MPGLGESKTTFNRDKEHSKTIAKRKVLERDKEQKLTWDLIIKVVKCFGKGIEHLHSWEM
jgi:hypothetical protein